MIAEVYTNDGGIYEGRHHFPVLPVVGDHVSIYIRDTDSWNTFLVESRDIHGYRGELSSTPRIILRLGRIR